MTKWLETHNQIARTFQEEYEARLYTHYTVSQFIRERHIARTTFYNHYPNGLLEVACYVLQQQLQPELLACVAARDWERGLIRYFNYLKQHPSFCENLYRQTQRMERHAHMCQEVRLLVGLFCATAQQDLPTAQRQILEAGCSKILIQQTNDFLEQHAEPDVGQVVATASLLLTGAFKRLQNAG
ncbi:hypothetical protein IV38_GL000422 [Lactobacillus selangorensis]|uniref:HTH tetR-type domain-containing protein n=1 Tax=Lactobacillus selangorensis TaxID=81857 RepID=A0A0R2GB04_9LACO|nr:hypothetical protein [Lactobacillus selangorensis]KRN29537.1 hypothetical protein IV38_GL000422 [Lactobacillus selangorensis]KRN33933.1 hypothetical protein IV40_GL000246 [Lactobacillus selangorensis]